MYVAIVPNRSSPPAILLRAGYREGRQVKTRTLANLSDWPVERIAALKRVLRGETVAPAGAALHIEREAALDGLYVIRTSVPTATLPSAEVVRHYKRLSTVERAFRSVKTVDLKVHPIHHHLAERGRAHVLLCMLAYYVEWHMRRDLAPLLFDDEDKPAAEALRSSVVAPAKRSPKAERKAHTKRTDDGAPVHSFQTLLDDLSTVAKNRVRPQIEKAAAFDVITTPTPLQQRAFDLLRVSPRL